MKIATISKLIPFLLLALNFGTFRASAQMPTNEKIQIGQKAPELAFNNPQGQIIKLSEVNKGRVVLLDFWASWCRPCRNANPKVVEIYKKYKDKQFKNAHNGFTIVSVSLDQQKDTWVAAIDQDKLIWPYHMSDLNSWNSVPADVYGVQFIPQAFLISPDGKVLAKYNYAEQAEVDLEKLTR